MSFYWLDFGQLFHGFPIFSNNIGILYVHIIHMQYICIMILGISIINFLSARRRRRQARRSTGSSTYEQIGNPYTITIILSTYEQTGNPNTITFILSTYEQSNEINSLNLWTTGNSYTITFILSTCEQNNNIYSLN